MQSSIIKYAFLLFFFISLQANAQSDSPKSYNIQIGAYKNVSESLLDKLEPYGTVHTESLSSLTRVSIGNINNWGEAQTLLATLQNEGFSDAFIKRSNTSAPYSALAKTTSESVSDAKISQLDRLKPEDRPFAVFLDGKLHLKRGDEFIPVN